MNAQDSRMGINIQLPVQLLVEGNDDKNFFEALSTSMGIDGNIQIQSFGGKDRLRKFLMGFVLEPKFRTVTRIGIIRDADEDTRGAFASVCGSLESAKLPVPDECEEFTNVSPVVGIMILPGNNQEGMLETLLCRTIEACPENDCIDSFIRCVEELRGCGISREHKARAHAYIATQSEPHVSVGVAAKKRFWNLEHDEFAPVRQFLADLINPGRD